MSSVLSAVKDKLNNLKQSVLFRTVLLSTLMLILIVSVTFAWYINNLSLWGVTFNTGSIDFNTYVYSENGALLLGPVASTEENETKYMNESLITIKDAEVNSTATAYIAVESTGSIGIEYRIAFDISGRNDKSNAYLGGYKYNIMKVTDKVALNRTGALDTSGCPVPALADIDDEVVTIDKNAVNGTIDHELLAEADRYDIYRVDFKLAEKNEEYTGNEIYIYFNIFATQIGGDFESTEERGRTYYCSSDVDIDRAKVEAYPGDIIKLSSDVTYTGDLVFNKPVHLETNDFTLTVTGNLMYDYVLGNSLKINAGGLGRIVVECTKEGVGGNFQIKAPISDVTIIGSNTSTGDIEVEKNVVFDATNAYGSAGVSFNEVRIVDDGNSLKTIQLESNTRATVSFGTTIGAIQSVVKANNIEIVNNGVIHRIDLSNMALLAQTNSPQIYILNNNEISESIVLPSWSEKFLMDADGNCTGNTKIVQSYSGSKTEVTGAYNFDSTDVDVEKKEFLVEQIEEGNDSRLRIYYQDDNGETTTIQSILENYLKYEATTGCTVNEVIQLEIVSIDNKPVTIADIAFMTGDSMLSLKFLNLQRAIVDDGVDGHENRLPDRAFENVSKFEELVLPQNLVAIGDYAFNYSNINNVITIPSGVTEYGTNWFYNGNYVRFAASVPEEKALAGMTNVKAIFVDEAYINSYKSVYSKFADKIYPTSVMDETKSHFVRNTMNDQWEITYYIKGDDTVIGENITIDKKILTITSVYDNAYRHNFNGTSVKFADSVENLGAANFINQINLTEVELNNLKYIGDEAFSGAASLKKVVFGDRLETIGAYAFLNCVSFNHDVVLPDTMQKIGASAFEKTKIISINSGGTTSIDGKAFYQCNDLIYAELPNVKVIGENGTNNLFEYCRRLVSVSIPSLTKANGARMFAVCESLREVHMATNDDNVTLGNVPFVGCTLGKLKLFVPEEYIEFYRSKLPGSIAVEKIFPEGEKMGEELVEGFNIGAYIVCDNGDDSYTLITSNIDYSGSLVIPEVYNEKPITHIYDHAFRNQVLSDVTLTIGNNIESIGSYAFYKLTGLLEVEFGNSIKTIGDYAFAGCNNLKQDIILPTSMQKIESFALSDTAILSVNTGGTTAIDGNAFENCTALVYAIMPEVTTVAENGTNDLFKSCTSLVSVDMPKVSKIYGKGMFRSCGALKELYMGSVDVSVSLVADHFFGVDSAHVKLFVPENLVSFYQERKIIDAKQVYPRGEKLGDKAVNGFVVGDYVVLKNDDGYALVTSNLEFEGDVVIPGTYQNQPITEIYANAFRNQTFTDAKLVLSTNVKTIGDGAFYGLKGLKSVVMDQVTTIGANAFYESGIQTLNAPKLTSVGKEAFRKCAALETVSIPKIENIESTYSFADCTALRSVYFENVMNLHSTTFYLDKNLEKITINRQISSNGSNMPATMTIESSAPCTIYVPYASKTAYGDNWSGKPVAFFDISATYNGDTYILADNNGRYTLIAFEPGQTHSNLTIPATVSASEIGNISITSISEGAFALLTETLKSVTLPSTLAQLNGAALSECSVLENIYVSADNAYFTSVNGILYSKDARILVKYPAGKSGRFDMTSGAYASTVGIGAGAFANAKNLTKIVFPASLVVIESTAFTNCTQLSTVEFTGNTPPILTGSGIFDTAVEGFRMVIPTADPNVVNAYLTAYNYAEYVPYIELDGATTNSLDSHNQTATGDQAMPNSGKEDEDDASEKENSGE